MSYFPSMREACAFHAKLARTAECPSCHARKGEPCFGYYDFEYIHPQRLFQGEAVLRLTGEWEDPSWMKN